MANGQADTSDGRRAANAALRRKLEAGRTSVAASRQVTPCKALSTALVQAVDARLGLAATVSSCGARVATLAELLELVPEGGLLGVLEGPGDAQGLMVLDPGLLTGVIEAMTTGRLSDRPVRPRRPTRTDAALCADLIDAVLRAFEAPFLTDPQAGWAVGFGYSGHLDDPRPLALMFEDIDYRIQTVEAELGGGSRRSTLLLAVPAAVPRGGAGRARAGAPPGPEARTGDKAGGGGGLAAPLPSAEGDLPWEAALEAQVMRGSVALRAVLHRVRLPLSALEAFRPGQEVPIPGAALDATDLVGANGAVAARGRLGQSGGRRAVRLGSSAIGGAETQGGAPGAPPWSGPDMPQGAGGPLAESRDGSLPALVGPHLAPTVAPDTEPGAYGGERAAGGPFGAAASDEAGAALPPLDGSAPGAALGGDGAGLPDIPDLPDLSDLPDPADLPPPPDLASLREG